MTLGGPCGCRKHGYECLSRLAPGEALRAGLRRVAVKFRKASALISRSPPVRNPRRPGLKALEPRRRHGGQFPAFPSPARKGQEPPAADPETRGSPIDLEAHRAIIAPGSTDPRRRTQLSPPRPPPLRRYRRSRSSRRLPHFRRSLAPRLLQRLSRRPPLRRHPRQRRLRRLSAAPYELRKAR
jgi:hypothetical protein